MPSTHLLMRFSRRAFPSDLANTLVAGRNLGVCDLASLNVSMEPGLVARLREQIRGHDTIKLHRRGAFLLDACYD